MNKEAIQAKIGVFENITTIWILYTIRSDIQNIKKRIVIEIKVLAFLSEVLFKTLHYNTFKISEAD